MYSGTFVFSQVMDHLPIRVFRKCVRRYGGNRYVKSFPCLSQFLCMAFAQLTHRESLRDIEIGLRAHGGKLYHMGIRGNVSRNTLANANKQRDWRIYAEFAQELIRIARPLHADDDFGLELDNTVFALDASTIDLCLSVSRGRCSAPRSRRSSSTRFSTCAATSPRSSMFRTRNWAT